MEEEVEGEVVRLRSGSRFRRRRRLDGIELRKEEEQGILFVCSLAGG